jgi:hypothetical protein
MQSVSVVHGVPAYPEMVGYGVMEVAAASAARRLASSTMHMASFIGGGRSESARLVVVAAAGQSRSRQTAHFSADEPTTNRQPILATSQDPRQRRTNAQAGRLASLR